jgi:hypothetical protein
MAHERNPDYPSTTEEETMTDSNEKKISQPTFGEKAVGLSFNPGSNPAVNACKKSFADVIDNLNELRSTSTDPEAKPGQRGDHRNPDRPDVGRQGNYLERLSMGPDQEVIDDVLNQCATQEDEGGSRWPAMSYEQGVAAAIRWMQGNDQNPMDD